MESINVAATLEDFAKLDLRVGEIVECWKHLDSENLYCLKVDMGDEIREIATGLQKFVKIDEMKGLVCALINIKPKKVAGFTSNGMILSSNIKEEVFELIRPAPGTKLGERIVPEGNEKLFDQAKQKQVNSKSKSLEKCLKAMTTDENCLAMFNGQKLKTTTGYVTSQTLKLATID